MTYPILANGQGSPQSVFQTSPEARHPIGARGVTEDGRSFYYARYSTAASVVAGKLLASAVYVSNHEDLATTASSLNIGTNVATAITIGATALTDNQYQYLAVVDGGGEGTIYRIDSHAAFDSVASTVRLSLADQVAVQSDANTQVSLIKSPYADCLTMTSGTDTDDFVAGITLAALSSSTAAAPAFVWLQTWGPSVAWVDFRDVNQSAPKPGGILVPSCETDGNLMSGTNLSQPHIGRSLSVAGTDAEVQPIFLELRP